MAGTLMLDQLLMDFKNMGKFATTDEAGTAVLQALPPGEVRKLRQQKVEDDPNLYNTIKSRAWRDYQMRLASQ